MRNAEKNVLSYMDFDVKFSVLSLATINDRRMNDFKN